MSLPSDDPKFLRASPALKIVWMILLLAIRDRHSVITFRRRSGNKPMVITYDGERSVVPPPRHLFSIIVGILRRAGRAAAKNPQSAFRFRYTETGKGKILQWHINHEVTHDIKAEWNGLIQKIHDAEERDRKCGWK